MQDVLFHSKKATGAENLKNEILKLISFNRKHNFLVHLELNYNILEQIII